MAQTPEPRDNPSTAVSAKITAAAPTPARRTKGERLFDWITYGGLGGIGTFIVTIPFADWAKAGSGKSFFEKLGNKTASLFKSAKTGHEVVMTTALGIGGTVMVAPIFVAERFKKPISEWLNQHFGNAQDKETHVENPAPQTAGSLIKGRVMAWLSVFAGFKIVGAITKLTGKPTMLGDFEEAVGKKTCEILKKPTHDALGAETKAYRYGKLGALDVFATTAATIILYSTSHMLAKRHAVHEEEKAARAGQAPVVPMMDSPQIAESNAAPVADMREVPVKTISGEKQHPGVIAADELAAANAIRA